jgi:hypothetical protein
VVAGMEKLIFVSEAVGVLEGMKWGKTYKWFSRKVV